MYYLISVLLFLSAVVVSPASQASDLEFQEGVHYFLLPEPLPTVNTGRIEVVEVFQYRCSHCFRFNSKATAWRQKLADDVVYVHLPATWRSGLVRLAKAYYTAKGLNQLEKLHPALFDATFVHRKVLTTDQAVADVFSEAGVDPGEFSRVFYSEEVNDQVEKAEAQIKAYKVISRTPRMIVNGKYWVSGKSAGGKNELMLDVVDFLIEKEREPTRQMIAKGLAN